MHAVIQTGGKQYRVQTGDFLDIEKLKDVEVGAAFTFDKVLAVGDGSDIKIGKPFIDGASVNASVVTHDKAKKVLIFKKKRRKGYQVKRGHRQQFTKVRITAVNG